MVEEDESTNLVFENYVFTIPQVSGVASVSIYNQGILLTNRAAPPHAPTVQFLAPAGCRLQRRPRQPELERRRSRRQPLDLLAGI